MVVVDALHRDSASAAADELFGGRTGYADLQAFFDHTALEVKASGCGSDGDEELEWLSNKDAFPTVETMDSARARPRTKGKGVRQSRAAVACSAAVRRECRHCGTQSTPQWREGPMGPLSLCNACGLKYRAGRLLPEYRPAKSPTFSPVLHSNSHARIVELRRLREEAVRTSLAAGVYGNKEGGQELERLPNKSVSRRAVDTMAPAWQRPRTQGLQRPRRALARSAPPPPRTPAPAGWRRSRGGGAGVGIQQGRVPGGGDDGAGGVADEGRRAAAPVGGGVEATAPRGLAVAGRRGCQGRRRGGMAVEQRRVPGSGDDGVVGDAAAVEGRAVGRRLNLPGGGEMALDPELGVPFVGDSCTAADKGPAAAAVPDPAWAVAQRWCQHCGTEETTQWRDGPEGRRTLCNTCGLWYKKSGRLVPEYRSATLSPTVLSNHRSNVQAPKGILRRLPNAGGGVEATVPRRGPVVAGAGPRRSQGRRDGMAVETLGGPGVSDAAAADEGRAVRQRLNQPGGGGGEMVLDQEPFAGDSCAAGGTAADKGRAAAASPAAHAAEVALPTPACAAAQLRCQHCLTETTPHWRDGPNGSRTLCNACGLWYKRTGRLAPEYRPASSPTFSPTVHSNRRSIVERPRASPVVSPTLHSNHRRIVQYRRASTVVTTAIVDAGDK